LDLFYHTLLCHSFLLIYFLDDYLGPSCTCHVLFSAATLQPMRQGSRFECVHIFIFLYFMIDKHFHNKTTQNDWNLVFFYFTDLILHWYHLQIRLVWIYYLWSWVRHLYKEERAKDLELNLVEHHVLFFPPTSISIMISSVLHVITLIPILKVGIK
jgi:hypothetical protein